MCVCSHVCVFEWMCVTVPLSDCLILQLVLKDQNERLQLRLDRLQNKFGDVANTKTDLSQQLLLSEEEKLKVNTDNKYDALVMLSE